MEPVPHPPRASWTDYQTWTDDERWEIIDGHPYAMSGPTTGHQILCTDLCFLLANYFKGKPCRVISSPRDVRLSEYDVVQPDLVVVCDKAQIARAHIEGPPTLVVEILSSSSIRHDRIRKARLYAAAGIQEYWILQPSPAMVEVLWLDGSSFRLHGAYSDKDRLVSAVFPDLEIELSELFPYEEVDEIREGVPTYRSAAAPAS
jgi:Uma2 family endonuclease